MHLNGAEVRPRERRDSELRYLQHVAGEVCMTRTRTRTRTRPGWVGFLPWRVLFWGVCAPPGWLPLWGPGRLPPSWEKGQVCSPRGAACRRGVVSAGLCLGPGEAVAAS